MRGVHYAPLSPAALLLLLATCLSCSGSSGAGAAAPAPAEGDSAADAERASATTAAKSKPDGAGESGASASKAADASPLPRGTLVLQIGDSFAESLGAPLGRRLVSAGLRNVLRAKTPSYTPGWAYGPELKRLVARYSPDLVLVTLGGNEFELPNPDERIPAVERIVQNIGPRPCVWITPPRWKKDTGILNVIREHAAPCHVLDSDTIVSALPRARDGIHPSEPGRERWADAVLDWLAHARDPAGPAPWSLRK